MAECQPHDGDLVSEGMMALAEVSVSDLLNTAVHVGK